MNVKKLLIVLSFSVAPLFGDFHRVTSENRFESLIDKYPYAVVCFSPSGAEPGQRLERDVKRQLRSEFKDLRRSLKAASDSSDYKKHLKKDVGFLVVDTASGRAQEVDDRYAIENFPTCLLFRNGRPISHRSAMAMIVAPISKASLLSFIDRHFEDELEELLEERKEEERQRRLERLAYARYGYGPYSYWGWGYPYRSWGYPYYGWGYRTWC